MFDLGPGDRFALAVTLLVGGAVVAVIALCAAARRPGRAALAAMALGSGLAVVGYAGLGWSDFPKMDTTAFLPVGGEEFEFREVSECHATTDRGRTVPLHRPTLADLPNHLRDREPTLIQDWAKKLLLIRVAPPDLTSNCHGYAFTHGHYWVRTEHVPGILEDNGYRPVAEAGAGDLAIYRSAGVILHTGVVRSAADGLVLIESKWGWLGRYVHTMEGQCYGVGVTYYRSPRKGHLLGGLPEMTAAPATLPRPGM